MAVVTNALLDAVRTTLQAQFAAGLKNTPNDWEKIATKVPSAGASNTYAWLGDFPQFVEWTRGTPLGAGSLKEYAFLAVNKKYGAALQIPREAIEDDTFGQYGQIAYLQGQAALRMQSELVFEVLAKGETLPCYDNQPFFNVEHPVYPNVDGTGTAVAVSNLVVGKAAPWVLIDKNTAPAVVLQERLPVEMISLRDDTGARLSDVVHMASRWRGVAVPAFWQCAYKSTADLNPANFAAARAAMRKLTDHGGRKLTVNPTHLVVGPDLQAAAETLINAMVLANGASNPLYKAVELVVTPYL